MARNGSHATHSMHGLHGLDAPHGTDEGVAGMTLLSLPLRGALHNSFNRWVSSDESVVELSGGA